MGNEKSQPSGLVIDETAIEVTNNWSLHGATYSVGSVPKISVFIGVSQTVGSQTMLDKFAKNIMINRHPCILKYIASWKKNGKLHLATEQIQPLAQVISSLTALQICVGLQSVLKALVFSHDYVLSSHNNVCRAAIYVTQGGSWKLGGLEYLCKFSEMTNDYLTTTRQGRYDPGICSNESTRVPQPPAAIDGFAFGVLAQEVLSGHNLEDVPGLSEFLDVCKNHLQNSESAQRPSLSSLLEHSFFSHDFIVIHNFLLDLPIKTDNEKQDFFRDLTNKLNKFPEAIVASQLGSLLLSRMVLLDTTAQTHLLPQLFMPSRDDNEIDSLFSENTFRTHIVPRLLPLFCVRDVHIRLILLSHFTSFCSLFSEVQLQSRILPELLVGIKDSSDILVSSTLRALADLVPILGSAVVIGGKRGKLFADGRPKAIKHSTKIHSKKAKPAKSMENFPGTEGLMCLPERASPDGGEDCTTPTASEEEETWTDWENMAHPEAIKLTEDNNIVKSSKSYSNADITIQVDPPKSIQQTDPAKALITKQSNSSKSTILQSDLTNLDVKITVKPTPVTQEIDFFQDMEPIISKTPIHHLDDTLSPLSTSHSKFDVLENDPIDGWGDDLDAWEDVESNTNMPANTNMCS